MLVDLGRVQDRLRRGGSTRLRTAFASAGSRVDVETGWTFCDAASSLSGFMGEVLRVHGCKASSPGPRKGTSSS